ncbi:MAG: hypothetical protein ACQR33_01075 [Candidatus Saccharibacteria bacterium]
METRALVTQPTYNPAQWHACVDHDYMTCRDGVNCYSYALNAPQYYWSVPGHGFVREVAQEYYREFVAFFETYAIDAVRRALLDGAAHDGLLPVDGDDEREGYYRVALVFAAGNNSDFHWYRQDDSGLWSHKNGWHPATNKDDDGRLITDPQTATRHDYPIFGGYFLVPNTGIVLTKTFAAAS